MPKNMDEVDNSIEIGKLLANPPAGEEVVISGLSGHYPESNNVYEFRDNLFNKVDMVTGNQSRWKEGHPEIPQRTGKVPHINQFDAGFFGINHLKATQMDPMGRLFLETAIEAIFDAGLHPSEFEGTNTGVFMGSCFSETEKTWFTDRMVPHGFAVIGCTRSMLAHNVSQHLKLKGPSFTCDTACSSSLYALENAYKALRMGHCDRAIVGGSNLCLHPYVSLQFARLGVLSMDGKCKAFDKTGDGYTRSEAVSAIILQKAKDAKRVYATILHAKTNCDGYKNSGITYPSGEMQVRLLNEFYQECNYIKPSELSFLEAHGTGTKVGDPEETGAIDEVFTKGRKMPLLIGSVKSNIGHSEPTSGLCSITKAIIAAETGYIPPNLHYKNPRPGIKGLEEGRLKVVTEKTPFNNNRGLIGVNSFGFGGGNCHVLLKHNPKEKTYHNDNIPRLVCVSGRNKEAIMSLLDDTCANTNIDVEHIRLLQEVFRKNVNGHVYRGYSIVSKTNGEITRSMVKYKYSTLNLIVCFGIIDEQTRKKAKEFLELPIAATALQKIQDVLNPKKINILNSFDSKSILEEILANFAIQVIFADLLKACQIKSNKTFGVSKGLSLGALVCAYFDEVLSLEQATECAFIVADIAQSLNFKGPSELIDLAEVLKSDDKAANKLQQEIAKVLKNKVTNNGPVQLSAAHLINGLNVNLLKNVKNMLENKGALVEIGNGTITEVLKGINKTKSCIEWNGGITNVLAAIGSLYELGFNPQIQNIFPKIEFPVSRGTPMISPLIKWNHVRKWWVTSYDCELIDLEEKSTSLVISDPAYSFMKGHVIDGRNLIPAIGYLQLAWETLAHVHGLMLYDMKVVFENCKFKRATPMPKGDTRMELTVMIQRGSGNFEVIEGGEPIVSGRIYHIPTDGPILDDLPMPCGIDQEIAPHMNRKDVYKELRLRGYNYSGQFRQIVSCDSSAQLGKIAWDGNWITFIDNMLQMNILQEDSRLLYVPTHIHRLVIDAKKHLNYAGALGEEPIIPSHCCKVTGITRSGGIEIRGQSASSIARKKYLGIPVLEKYVFVPNIASLSIEKALRVNMQILLENLPSLKVKVVELIDEATNAEQQPLVSIIDEVLGDIPLIQPDLTILSQNEYDIKNVKVERQLLTVVDCSLIIGSKLLERNSILKLAFGSIKENGFILSREPLNVEISPMDNKEINIITIYSNDKEKLVLLRKSSKFNVPLVIQVSSQDTEFSWVPKLQSAMTKKGNVLVLSQGEPLNGVLGLVSCLRREPGGGIVQLVFTQSPAPDFDMKLSFYRDQLNKNLAFNVYKDGQWGTYRHLLLDELNKIKAEQCYLNSLRRGDLSSLTWIEGPLKINARMDPDKKLVYVHYAAINFRDIMLASGKLNADAVTRDRLEQECVLGFEFSGLTENGKRVMGMGPIASIVSADEVLLWNVPEHWSLDEAITVPVVYATSIVGLLNKAKIKEGETVLIHSGTGGVGLSAIQIALYVGCVVYTTVGTLEKREFLKRRFPQLKDCHISNSRTTEFEQHIMKETNGKGVNVVLNSLAEDKLQASVRCLAQGGRFIEIGKFDLANNNSLSLLFLEKEASFHGVMVDGMMKESPETKMQLHKSLEKLLNAGAIRPLPTTVFKMNEAEAAFRYMTTGKHIGKVVLQIREENKAGALQTEFLCQPRYYCDPDKTYIICGGLGGFGLELADWLVLRGCRNLVLTSRSGVKTGYQAYRISIWKSYGCTISISTDDITTHEGCVSLIEKSNELGPVHAIFNLAVVLKDGIFDNQTPESFEISFGPKANATAHLDAISRNLCPVLRDFVIFSSVSCGRGNAGQSNYGMSNSVMERICENRRMEGLPALAIEWGAVGDVGLVADMQDEAIDMEIGGTLQQRISNCLEVMDQLLKQTESAIVSSIVVAEKKSKVGNADTIVDAVTGILGIDNLKAISLQATLAEAGMDSMTAVEIKQTLEREHEVYLSAQDIKSMTFAKLLDIQAEIEAEKLNGVKKERPLNGMDMILRNIPDEASANTISVKIALQEVSDNKSTVFLFSGIEGQIKTMEPLFTKLMAAYVIGLQYPNDKQQDTIEDMAKIYSKIIEANISKKDPFKIICYSFGGSVALETVKLLEQKGYSGIVICIDAAPKYLQGLANILEVDAEEKLQISLIVHIVTLQHPYEVISKHIDALMKRDTFEDKIKFAQSVIPRQTNFSPEYEKEVAVNIYKRLKALVKWTPDFKLKSKVFLFKPSLVSIHAPDEVSGLNSLCQTPVTVHHFEGNHVTVLENPELVQVVNEVFGFV